MVLIWLISAFRWTRRTGRVIVLLGDRQSNQRAGWSSSNRCLNLMMGWGRILRLTQAWFLSLMRGLETGRLGDWETGRLGDWETGRLGDWETGRLGDWETGRLGDWETGRLGDWETGRFGAKLCKVGIVHPPNFLLFTSYLLPFTFYLRAIVSHFVSWRQFNQIKKQFCLQTRYLCLNRRNSNEDYKEFLAMNRNLTFLLVSSLCFFGFMPFC